MSREAATTAWPDSGYAWRVTLLLSLTFALAYVDRIVLSVLAPSMQRDLALSDTELGVLGGAAFAVTYTILAAPVGLLVDRFSRRLIVAYGTVTWSAATLLCGLSGSFWQLLTARAAVGAGEATLQPAASSLIADLFPRETRSRAYGVFLAGTSVGTAVSYLVGGSLLEYYRRVGPFHVPGLGPLRDWQFVFVALAVAGLLVASLYTAIREPVRREQSAGPGRSVPAAQLKGFLARNSRIFAAHHLGMALYIAAIYGKTLFMPTYFVRVHGWEPLRLGQVFGVVALITGIGGAITSGWFIAWLARRGSRDAAWRVMLAGIAGTAAPIIVLPYAPSDTAALVAFSVSAIFTNWPMVGALTALNEITPNALRGQVTAIYTSIIGLLAAGAGPLAVGVVVDHVFGTPGSVGMAIAAVFAFAAAVSLTLLAWGRPSYVHAAAARAAIA